MSLPTEAQFRADPKLTSRLSALLNDPAMQTALTLLLKASQPRTSAMQTMETAALVGACSAGRFDALRSLVRLSVPTGQGDDREPEPDLSPEDAWAFSADDSPEPNTK